METEKETLAPVLNSLPPEDGLKDILNQALITSSLEVIKFNRGDYVNSARRISTGTRFTKSTTIRMYRARLLAYSGRRSFGLRLINRSYLVGGKRGITANRSLRMRLIQPLL